MDMTRLLMRRSAWISLACFCVVLILAGFRARLDIHREGQGADQIARLVGELTALQDVEQAGLGAQLDRLRAISRSGVLRHLDFQLEDGAGQVLIPAAPAGIRADQSGQTRLLLKRSDGSHFQATLMADPASEKEEALINIAGMSGLFLAYGLALLAGLYWAIRYAFRPLQSIIGTIARYRQQDFSARLPRQPVKELDHIASALNALAEALSAAEQRQKLLSLQIQTLQEDERARLAISLHESLGQELTALRANAAYLIRQSGDNPRFVSAARDVDAQGAAVQRTVRSLLVQLQPTVAGRETGKDDTLPIRPLLHELVKSWQDVPGQNTRFHLDVTPSNISLPRDLGLSVYRMTQEALSNVHRHAAASTVHVCLSANDGGELCWSVTDDGSGISALEPALGHGSGLSALRERVWAHGGRIEIGATGAAGQGATGLRLAAWLPLASGV